MVQASQKALLANERLAGAEQKTLVRQASTIMELLGQLTAGEAVLAGGRSRRPDQETASTPWVFAPDGAGLSTQLRTLGMLDPRA